MNDPTQVTRIEQSIEIESTPERLFAVLTDPNMITRYAGGIEGAEILDMPNGPDDYTGAKLQLVTISNNLLGAEVVESEPPRRLAVRDERGLLATWTIVDVSPGKIRLENVIEGMIPPEKALKLQYDADVKFQHLQDILENGEGFVHQTDNAEKATIGHGPV